MASNTWNFFNGIKIEKRSLQKKEEVNIINYLTYMKEKVYFV